MLEDMYGNLIPKDYTNGYYTVAKGSVVTISASLAGKTIPAIRTFYVGNTDYAAKSNGKADWFVMSSGDYKVRFEDTSEYIANEIMVKAGVPGQFSMPDWATATIVLVIVIVAAVVILEKKTDYKPSKLWRKDELEVKKRKET